MLSLSACDDARSLADSEQDPGTTALMDGGTPSPDVDGSTGISAPVDGGAPRVTGGGDGIDAGTPAALGCLNAPEPCVEAHGIYHGKPFSCAGLPGAFFGYREGDGDETRLLLMLSHCSEGIAQLGAMIPVGKSGPFDYDISRGADGVLHAWIEHVDEAGRRNSVDSDAADFSGHTKGTVTPARTVQGTYGARWLESATNCQAQPEAALCGETWFTMTFHVRIPG